jgi:hypothetical protein
MARKKGLEVSERVIAKDDPESYLTLLETSRGDKEVVKAAVRGFRRSLPIPLELDEFAAKLKVDPRTARGWEENGIPMRPGILARFRALLNGAGQAIVIETALRTKSLGVVTLGELLEEKKGEISRIIICTCNPLKEQVRGSQLRNEVLNSMIEHKVKYLYVFPKGSPTAESFNEYKKSLRDELRGLVDSKEVGWETGFFSFGVVYIIVETKPEPGKGMPEGATFGYIYGNMEFTNAATEKGLGHVCAPMGSDLYEMFMSRLQSIIPLS